MASLKRIKYRIFQFVSALGSKITFDEVQFAQGNLTKEEQILFFSMNSIDQKHSLTVARRCIEHAKRNKWINESLIIRAALLHDIGKTYSRISLHSRILFVVLNHNEKLNIVKLFARKDSKIKLFKDFYTHLYHAQLGYELLSEINDKPEMLQIVRDHHSPPKNHESKLLPVIRYIDSQV